MDYEKFKESVLPLFISKLSEENSLQVTNNGTFKENDSKIDSRGFSSWYIARAKEHLPECISILGSVSTNILFEDLKKAVRSHNYNNKHKILIGSNIEDFSYNNLIPIVSIHDVNKKIFYDTKKGTIHNLDYKTYELTVNKEDRVALQRGVILFNPYRPEQSYNSIVDGRSATHINLYKKPSWQYGRQLEKEEIKELAILPNIIDKFFSHLFPDLKSREYVYDWLHFALTKRCETYLVLNGAKGIGKGVFTDHICKSLLGKENHKIAPQSALDSNFNAILENCRMIIFDEFRIDDDDKISKLKRYINKDQMIEHKGVDVATTIETYNSFVISSNSLTDIKISWDDRRFSVVDIADTKLNEKWSSDEISELIYSIDDEYIMRQFGYWLLYREPKDNEFSVYKGKHFHSLCYSSLFEWQRVIIDTIISKQYETISEGEIRMALKDRNSVLRLPSSTKVVDFLKNYKYEGEHYLGVLYIQGNTWYIEVDSKFKPDMTSGDSTGIEWEIL